jgi:hypothetical protein
MKDSIIPRPARRNWLLNAGIAGLIALAAVGTSCEQSDPPTGKQVIKDSGDLIFSGYGWKIKSSTFPVGPGPCYFNGDSCVWVDKQGRLHMEIAYINGKWQTSEIINTANTGYGTYIFTVDSDISNFNDRVVLGLFTWDNNTFIDQGNSEVDIEFAKWFKASDTLMLTTSVQPVSFENSTPYAERTYKPLMQVSKLKKTTTHAFKWTPDEITWSSYAGDQFPGTEQIASWRFDKSNQSRVKIEGGISSKPIVIPAPGATTNARINLWLLNGLPPSDNKPVEVILKSFEFIPQ